ncbi:hypothetical protein PHLGIDRAFT_245089 [Phlebiopsis gigantea 11061_1 CR5-6]|uniref:MYND-type domain-containing protein n=1 Tax=Phlebiopsis gigantea (strain 11061_1 CR5-6) TaxID=745531 RepID=A0A0C3RSG1_PHLG1|nr:hypothetical protein PHLGIDRAFT_245089 [Phlebiopsis gigantea 11061_1 CR5-6]
MAATPGRHFDLDRLSEALSRLTTTDEKASTIVSHFADPQSAITPAGAELFDNEEFSELLDRHGVSHFDLARAMPSRAKFALEKIPCAYINVNTEQECLKDGTAVCTNCRLVLYCSKECQKRHWKVHKEDCKSYLRSKDWEPGWVEEQRAPTFMTGTPRNSSFSNGMALWGGIPAIDILNVQGDGSKTNDALDIAFIGMCHVLPFEGPTGSQSPSFGRLAKLDSNSQPAP